MAASDRSLDPVGLDWFDSMGGRLVLLDHSDAILGRWCAEHNVEWALQRPDFHLYGTATSAEGASGLLEALRDHLSPSQPVQGVPE